MAVFNKLIEGKIVSLKPVGPEDAEFTLSIRNNPELTKYMPKVNGTIDDQRNWIERQRDKEGDYFFLILDKMRRPLGTVSIYNINKKTAESGRFISVGDSMQNMEAILLIYDFAFYTLNLDLLYFEVFKQNKMIINMWKRLGSVITGEKVENETEMYCFELGKKVYEDTFRPRIAKALYSIVK